MSKLHLVCNAHLDPIWLWEWEEGAAEAISTFRTAAELCEQFDGFIFNHNEVVLYEWVEEYDPPLFARIQRLVADGKWRIMGGWYLQPDCNMPSGESFVRQIRYGRDYFRDRFGVEPSVAINFDPFGHSRGLVQIMAKAGYSAYVFCRPGVETIELPGPDFLWEGFDGSSIVAHRAWGHYLSALGKATEKIDLWIDEHSDAEDGLLLWGVGNHGGGPSRADLTAIGNMIENQADDRITHSFMESYFEHADKTVLVTHADDINPWAVGCYTSQIRIKQKHRALENELYSTEKMLSAASALGIIEYPESELRDAERDLLFGEFHDILPGSSIKPAEDAALRTFDHGLEIVSRLKARAFFALASHEPPGDEKNIPVFFYNPHPYPVRGVQECEFQLADQQRGDRWTVPTAYVNGEEVPCQLIKEESNLNLDWRKRIAVAVDIPASSLLRVDCRLALQPGRPQPSREFENGRLVFSNESITVAISEKTGLVDSYIRDGKEYLNQGSFQLLVVDDSDDPWEMRKDTINTVLSSMKPLDPSSTSEFAGIYGDRLSAVRVIEDGLARTVVEALLGYKTSRAVVHYLLPKQGSEIEIRIFVYWNEKRKMLKLSVPTTLSESESLGQTAFGVQKLKQSFKECVAQKWVGVFSTDYGATVVNNGTYGVSCHDGEMRLSLLRSPGYSVHPIDERPLIPEDRFLPRIDQGERRFRFWFDAGSGQERLHRIDRDAQVRNEAPFGLSFNPGGQSGTADGTQLISIDQNTIVMSSFSKRGDQYVLRLYESAGLDVTAEVSLPVFGIRQSVAFTPFEVKTFEIEPSQGSMSETRIDR